MSEGILENLPKAPCIYDTDARLLQFKMLYSSGFEVVFWGGVGVFLLLYYLPNFLEKSHVA